MSTTGTPKRSQTRRKPPRHSHRPHGRPTKLTPETWAKILEKARTGLPLKYCALAAGTSADTVEEWRSADPNLEAELAEARAIAADAAWQRIVKAGEPYGKRPGDWRSDSWRLEKSFPADFAKPPEVAINNNVTTNTAIQITIVESREIESRTASVDAQVDELFNDRRRAIRDLE